MKDKFVFLHNKLKDSKLLRWGKLITISGATQIIVQAISFVSGIIIIRLLSTEEYAFYTLSNTMLGTMTILADSGITTGVMALGAKVWQDREKLGIVLVTGLDLRKRFSIISLVISSPILVYLLRHHDASWPVCILVTVSILPAFFTTLSGSLLQIPLKLLQDIIPLQKNQLQANIGRLLMLVSTLFMFPSAFMAILSSGVPQIWSNRKLYKLCDNYIDWNQQSNIDTEKKIQTYIKKVLPSAIYVCFSGQITLWLISIFGSTTAIAQIGALARLTLIFNVFSVLFNTLISPRFATMTFNSSLLLTRYVQIQIGLFILCLCIVFTTQLFSKEILWVLGKEYSMLNKELVLTVIGGCFSLTAGCSVMLYTSKGWVINPFFSIAISISSVVLGILLVDLKSIEGVLKLNLIIVVVQTIIHSSYILYRIKSKFNYNI